MNCSYLVCATQRSGSTLLCELLKDTDVAGRPEEYFEARRETGLPGASGPHLPARHHPERSVRLQADVEPDRRAACTRRRVSEFAGLDAFELLQKLFDGPTFIHVTRRDKVRQAVSLWRALQTRSWRREHAPGDDLSDDWTAAYHRDAARERVGAGAALSTT